MVSHASSPKAVAEPAPDTVAVPVPAALVASIDALAGPEGRAAFVRAALDQRVRRMQAVRSFVGHLSDLDVPEWETEESTAAWLRDVRDWPDRWRDDTPDGQP